MKIPRSITLLPAVVALHAQSVFAADTSGAPPAPTVIEARVTPLSDARFDTNRALRWERRPGGLAGQVHRLLEEAAKDGWLAGLVRDLEPVRTDKKAAGKLIDRTLKSRPELDTETRKLLQHLLREDQLLGDWDPDTGDDRDAIAHGPARMMAATTADREKREVFQAAALVRADLTTLKQAENDHRETADMIGVVYERLSLVRNSLVRGEDEALGPFAALKIDFTMDVPWPFGSIDARVHSLSRLDAHGHLVTDVYATGDDVLWFEGRDVFLPILDTDGTFVATLVVRSLGFDMSGLPDFEFAQRHGITAGLGNLKRMAESRAALEVEDVASGDTSDASGAPNGAEVAPHEKPLGSGRVPVFGVTLGS